MTLLSSYKNYIISSFKSYVFIDPIVYEVIIFLFFCKRTRCYLFQCTYFEPNSMSWRNVYLNLILSYFCRFGVHSIKIYQLTKAYFPIGSCIIMLYSPPCAQHYQHLYLLHLRCILCHATLTAMYTLLNVIQYIVS